MFASILEPPIGTLNGTNTTFMSTYSMDESIRIFLNGVSYPDQDTTFGFTVTYPYTLTLTSYVPLANDDLQLEYITHNGV